MMESWSAQICNGDQDFYVFEVNEVSDVEVNVLFDHDLGDIDVSLFDEAMEPIDSSASSNDDETLQADALESGRYFIFVRGFGMVENSYEFDVTITPIEVMSECMNDDECRGDYICAMGSCVIPEGYCEDIAAPNQEVATAYAFMIPGTIDNIALCDDDFFALDLVEGQTINIQVSFSNQGGEDIDMKLYVPDGSLVAASIGVEEIEEISFTAEVSGIHILQVYPYYGLAAPFVTRYTLAVNEVEVEDE